MRIRKLRIDCNSDGSSIIEVDVTCCDQTDIVNVGEWLECANLLMTQWDQIVVSRGLEDQKPSTPPASAG